MRHDGRDTRPAWSLIALFQVGLVALIEVSVPPGALRTTLESAVVVAGFGLMLTWRRLNRARIDLGRNRV